MKTNYTPKDLAKLVFKRLRNTKSDINNLKLKHLVEIFEILFYASLKTEESQHIKVTITFLNPENKPDINKSKILNNWQAVRFTEQIPYSVKHLVKLSKAADPWSTSIAVYFNNDDNLYIWGLIDQQIHYQSFLNYETTSKPHPPGLFQSTITGIGSLIAIFDYELVATLKQNLLIHHHVNVFNYGEVSKRLKEYSIKYVDKTKVLLETKFSNENTEKWMKYPEKAVNSTLSRILLGIQNYKHGGAILITTDFNKDIEIKHKLDYDRLHIALENHIRTYIEESIYSKINIEHLFKRDAKDNYINSTINESNYADEILSKIYNIQSKDELKGTIRFISSLSCIDGLIVLSNDFIVRGFGAIITSKELPKHIYISKTAKIKNENLIETNPNHLGTRHQSMFSYCYKNKGAIGFVVSQDGDIRVVMNINSKIIVWENIKVQQFLKSNNLRNLMNEKLKER